MNKKRVLFYCQHVLGMGHLIRSMAIAKALQDFEVCFVNGGETLPGMEVPPWITVVNLPPMTSDGEFKELRTGDNGSTVEQIQHTRRTMLLEVFDRLRPDIVIVELFPFGRKRFAFELLPLLAHIRLSGGATRVVCSLRDILVKKSDQTRHEEWVVSLMNRYFDLLLIHSDPGFQTLDETFSRLPDLRCPGQYTGFVMQEADEPAGFPLAESHSASDGQPLILVSIGGGRVGFELVEGAIRASSLLTTTHPHRMLVFTGPYMPDEQYEQLQRLVEQQPHNEISRFTPHFQSLMKQAGLSISMAGYNTCMNILDTGTKALVLPFTGHGNEEQTIRAKKLQSRGLLTLLEPEDLQPERLAAKIVESLTRPVADRNHKIDTGGSRQTAVCLGELLSKPEVRPRTQTMILSSPATHQPAPWVADLRQCLASHEAAQRVIHLFLRDDDVDEDEESLGQLLDIGLARHVPLNLEIIPGLLTAAGVAVLKNALRADPALFSLNQHGWRHTNHEPEGRKCEFGPARTLAQQIEDIAQGKALLEATFDDRFYPAFTPPWNRCTVDTYAALDELGFTVFSKDRGKQPIADRRFLEISTTLDLYTWKDGAKMKAPDEIIRTLIAQTHELPLIGLLLHHKVMDAEAFSFLDRLLSELKRSPAVRFHTFQTLARMDQNEVIAQNG